MAQGGDITRGDGTGEQIGELERVRHMSCAVPCWVCVCVCVCLSKCAASIHSFMPAAQLTTHHIISPLLSSALLCYPSLVSLTLRRRVHLRALLPRRELHPPPRQRRPAVHGQLGEELLTHSLSVAFSVSVFIYISLLSVCLSLSLPLFYFLSPSFSNSLRAPTPTAASSF